MLVSVDDDLELFMLGGDDITRREVFRSSLGDRPVAAAGLRSERCDGSNVITLQAPSVCYYQCCWLIKQTLLNEMP